MIHKVKTITGEWCRPCVNVIKKAFLEKKLKNKCAKQGTTTVKSKPQRGKDQRFANVKEFKNALIRKAELRGKLLKYRSEWVHLRVGGRSRVTNFATSVKRRVGCGYRVLAPAKKFVTLSIYKKRYGDPKITGAKIKTLRNHRNKKVRGCIVRQGEKGVYGLEQYASGDRFAEEKQDNTSYKPKQKMK